jgi:hypothetical protein
MNKEEYIKKYGGAAYEKQQQQCLNWAAEHREEGRARANKWAIANPDKVIANARETTRKGGKHYEKHLKYESRGLRGARNHIRVGHGQKWRRFKQIIAPESQLHHQWIPETANYTGVALVEADQHRHGIIVPIQILEGEITLLTEAEIRGGKY